MTEPEMIRIGQGPPPATRSVRRRRTGLIVALIAGNIAITAGVAAAAFLAFDGPTGPDAITVTGTVAVIDGDLGSNAGQCYGTGGYDDMHAGQKVVVKDAGGKVVALGELDPGRPITIRRCVFEFTVTGVPRGSRFYTVQIAHRGELTYTEKELALPISLSLGG